MNNTAEMLHQRWNPRNEHIPPVRIKGFKRYHLSQLFAELGYKVGAEIGVAQGIHALEMCQLIPGLELYGIDPWQKYLWKDSQEENDRHYDETRKKLEPYGATLIRAKSEDAYRGFADESLDFVYIDGNHAFDYVMLDLIFWSRKVKVGGIVSLHDGYRFRGAGVVDAISTYTFCHQIHEYFICDEREQSVFWVKT